MKVRSDVFKSLENARNEKLIGKSFEAHVELYVSDGVKAELEKLNANVRQLLIVSLWTFCQRTKLQRMLMITMKSR